MDLDAVNLARRAWSDLLDTGYNTAAPPRPLYSLVWRLQLGGFDAAAPETWAAAAHVQRRAYRHLCTRYTERVNASLQPGVPDDAHPLQGGGKTLWQTQKETQELLALIELDLQRLASPLSTEEMSSLSRILTVWSYANTDIGYRQGMHEIVSRLWSIRSRESLPCTTSVLRAHVLDAAALHTLLDAEAVEADTFFLFSHLMQRIAPYYLTERSNSPALIKAVLHRVDPLLGQHLASLQLDWPPILLRWHRLLFMHECSEDVCDKLWDMIFILDPQLHIVPYLSTTIVLSNRSILMEADYISAMQLLMRDKVLDQPTTLVQEASQLQSNPSPEKGAIIAAAHNQQWQAQDLPKASIDTAKALLYELTSAGTQRLFAHTPTPSSTEWSPGAEARLQTGTSDTAEQRRRAMLSLEDTQ